MSQPACSLREDVVPITYTSRFELPDSLSQPLRNLLSSLLVRDPLQRPPVPSLWDDPWITRDGTEPLPDYEENVWTEIDEPSGEEVTQALASLRGSTFLAMSAAAKFKSLLKRSSTNTTNSDGTKTPPAQDADNSPSQSPLQSPVLVDSPDFVASPAGTGSYPSSPLASPTPNVGSTRKGTRPPPRYQNTVSILSIGEATSRWQLSPTSTMYGDEGEEPIVCTESPQQEKELREVEPTEWRQSPAEEATGDDRPRRQEGEIGPEPAHHRDEVPRSPSPTILLAGTDEEGEPLAAGTEEPSAEMDEAGVEREDLERLQPDDSPAGQVWEDPE